MKYVLPSLIKKICIKRLNTEPQEFTADGKFPKTIAHRFKKGAAKMVKKEQVNKAYVKFTIQDNTEWQSIKL